MSFTDYECVRISGTIKLPLKEAQSLIQDSCIAQEKTNEKTEFYQERHKQTEFLLT